MPLKHGKSEAAFEHNFKAEMDAGKPKAQSLAIAYDVKRRAKKKKMAKGGMANESAASEARPMPEERDKDAAMVARNSGKKALKDADWTDNPSVEQAQKPRQVPLSRPKLMGSDAFSVRYHDEIDQDLRRMSSEAPADPKEQPKKSYDEVGPDRRGPQVPDMADSHSTRRKPYAKGGEVEQSDYAARPNKYMDDLQDLPPSHDEGDEMAMSHNEMGPDRQGPHVPDMEEPHNEDQDKIYGYAYGGSIEHEMNDVPHEEAEEEHDDSIAAAIMARRKENTHSAASDSDIDREMMMAHGGEIMEDADEIHSHDSIYPSKSSQADLSRNADEDANEEDHLSFNAIRKENYDESDALAKMDQPMDSNEHGHNLPDEDSHDMVDKIRSKMNKKRQFPKV